MKSNDFVKYLTIQVVERMDHPKGKIRGGNKTKKSLSTQWFGIIPLSLKIFLKRFQKN